MTVRPQGSLGFMLRALRYRNYRLFFSGQALSLVGTWVTTTATNWLVYRLTGSAVLLGVVGFAGQFPAFVLGPVAGIFVDRWDRHRLLLVTQSVSMLQSFALATLTLGGWISIKAIILLSVVQGLVNAFDMPGRQSFFVSLIEDKADLGNASFLMLRHHGCRPWARRSPTPSSRCTPSRTPAASRSTRWPAAVNSHRWTRASSPA